MPFPFKIQLRVFQFLPIKNFATFIKCYWEKSLIDWVESESKVQKRQLGSEMEFLDISLAKDSILLLHAIHTVLSTGEY